LFNIDLIIIMRNSSYCCSASKPSQFCPSVCQSVHPSVCRTSQSVKNGASWDHQIFFTFSCL